MDGDRTAQLIYYGILIFAVAGALIGPMLRAPGKVLQQALIWVSLFMVLIAGYGLWPEISRQLTPGAALVQNGAVELQRGADGHFYADIDVDGTIVTFAIDTGASQIVLNRADAERIGFDPDTLSFTGQALTANGIVATAPVRLNRLTLGPFEDLDVPATVNGGDLDISLLGMSYLSRYSIAIEGNRMRLSR